MPVRYPLAILLMTLYLGLIAQDQTVGLFSNTEASFDGYTLMSPMVSSRTYLIDNCGYVVKQWDSDYRPGLSSYLLEDGDLLRTGYLFSQFNSGGAGGRIERYSWDGELEWGYNYAAANFHQHHDIEPLPNGNFLLIAWEKISREEAIALGRDSTTVSNGGLWPDHVVEIEPFGTDGGNIVWRWNVKDHIVQDVDTALANFGEVSEHPELIDINRSNFNGFPSGADWNHCNGIDYLPEYDLIAISSRNFSEVWVIDHGTTTEEAAGHSGGRYGKGGDLLYRWGNPASYGLGTGADRFFYGQHDPSWKVYDDGRIGLMVYNNGVARPEGRYSSVDEIILPELTDTGFVRQPDMPYGPEGLYRTWDGGGDFEFYSSSISGAQRQPNGNVLICVGGAGRLIEVDSFGDIVWDYINPDAGSPITQGEPAGANNVFKVFRYSPDYPGLNGRELVPGERIELEPYQDDCELFPEDTTTSVQQLFIDADFRLIGNPVQRHLTIVSGDDKTYSAALLGTSSSIEHRFTLTPGTNSIDVSRLPAGVYTLVIHDESGRYVRPLRIVKV